MSAAGARSRRELTVAVLLCALAGALSLSASSQAWAHVTITREAPLPATTEVLTGGLAAPLVSACGLLLLAATVALIAVRGVARALVGLLLAVAGGALGWSGARALHGGLADYSLQLPAVARGPGPVNVDVSPGWPWLVVVAGVLAVLAGVLVVLRGRSWPGMGRRYERTGATGRPATATARPARPETDEDRHQAAWKALDRGDDPTV